MTFQKFFSDFVLCTPKKISYFSSVTVHTSILLEKLQCQCRHCHNVLVSHQMSLALNWQTQGF